MRYVPSLLIGKFVVRNQTPEYTGGLQKRFAWSIGWLISLPMMQWFVLHWDITFYKVLICVLCLTLMFLEGAFSICIGCMIYRWIVREDPQHCPGGACEVRRKDPIQQFNPVQAVLAAGTVMALAVGLYLFLARVPSKTFFGEFLHEAVLTHSQLEKEEDQQFEQEFNDTDDDF